MATGKSELQTDQVVTNNALPITRQAANTNLDTIFSSLDSNAASPLRLFASNPSNTVLNIAAQEIQKADGTGLSVPPISSLVPTFAATTIDFQALTTSGGTVSITWPTGLTVGNYYRVGFTLLSGNTLQATFSSGAGTLGAVANAGTLFITGGIPVGWVDLQATSSTQFKTAGSATSIIENSVSGTSTIHTFGSGAGGSGSGSGTGVGSDLDSLQFQALFLETFSESTTSSNSAVNGSAGYTNASYSAPNQIWTIFYDAGRTINATGTTTTNINLDASVSGFTAAVGDMIIVGGYARRITAVASQSSFTTEAFPAIPTASAQTTVSQAIHTKDIYNAPINGVQLADEFGSATFSEIMVDYKDNATNNSNIFTPNVTPNFSFTASPDNTNWTTPTARPSSTTTQVPSTYLPSAGTSLYLRFFANKTSGTGYASLISYNAFMQKALAASSGYVVNQASGATNVIGTAQNNLTLSTVGGKTTATLGFNYPIGANSGLQYGALQVLLNGQLLSRGAATASTVSLITPWQSFSPTLGNTSGTTTLPTAAVTKYEWRRVNDTMELLYQIQFTSNAGGSNGSGQILFPIPSGYTIDSSKISINSSATTPLLAVGSWQNYNGTFNSGGIVYAYNSTNLAGFVFGVDGASTTAPQYVGAGGNLIFTDASGNITIKATVPIVNWSTATYYTEYASNAIQLDADYSSFPFNLLIYQPVAVVDSNTQNTTAIANMQEFIGDGFQGYVNPNENIITATNTTGTPAAGTFYSSITNRASMTDISQDLKPRMGVERVMTQSMQLVQGEFGSNGESIWSVPNDINGQIRFVGNWSIGSLLTTSGQGPVASTSGTDYLEVTFYGTGLNLLTSVDSTAKPMTYYVDGGGGTSVTLPTTSSAQLETRNYAPNQVVSIVSGLALGIHTVKIASTGTTTSGIPVYGFEYLLPSSNVTVNPGIGYISGKKNALTAQSTFAYGSPATGTKGGRVVIYQSNAGAVGTAFTAVATSPSYTSSTNHSNEEVVRTYYPREFGSGQTTDFSRFSGSTLAAFTLDDGVTSLAAFNGVFQTLNNSEGLAFGAATNIFYFTFVGCGLDIQTSSSSFTGTVTSNIDGAGANTLTIPSTVGIVKLASGLPYGTHVCQLTLTAAGSGQFNVNKFIVYQPLTPSIPSGAIQIGSYNVLANYVANTTQSAINLGTGVIRKGSMKEMLYGGGWSVIQQSTSSLGFFNASSTFTTGTYVQYTFFGTGFEFRFETTTAAGTYQVTVDGATNLSSFTTSSYGTGLTSFVASTGIITMSAQGSNVPGLGIQVSGLTLGMHTVKVAWASGGTMGLNPDSFDIITPIYATRSNIYEEAQNALPVGSNSLSDDRALTPIKNPVPATKAWAQAVGVTSSPSTSSTAFIPIPDMSCTIKTSGGPIQVMYGVCLSSSQAQTSQQAIYVDGVQVKLSGGTTIPAAGYSLVMSDSIIVPVSAGTHKVDVYWSAQAATTTAAYLTERSLSVREI